MKFLLLAYDYKDAFERRLSIRDVHIKYVDSIKSKCIETGGAILDETGKMVGSMLIYTVESREELDQILSKEPYITHKVWEEIKILSYKTGPSFTWYIL